MDSRQSLSGAELFALFLEDQTDPQFHNPDNLKLLLNHALNNIEETIDSNLEMEIVDFCVARLQVNQTMDEKRIAYYREKYNLAEKEQEYERKIRRWKKLAATAAVFVVMVGAGLFFGGNNVSQAGIIEWIINLFVEDKGEQLSISTGDMYLSGIEMKEGHLPEKLPDEFVFEKSYSSSSSITDYYAYRFINQNNEVLFIEINEYKDSQFLTNKEIEIHNNSNETKSNYNHTYYYSCNESRNTISWVYNNTLYIIRGNFEYSKLEEILNFYEEEQI